MIGQKTKKLFIAMLMGVIITSQIPLSVCAKEPEPETETLAENETETEKQPEELSQVYAISVGSLIDNTADTESTEAESEETETEAEKDIAATKSIVTDNESVKVYLFENFESYSEAQGIVNELIDPENEIDINAEDFDIESAISIDYNEIDVLLKKTSTKTIYIPSKGYSKNAEPKLEELSTQVMTYDEFDTYTKPLIDKIKELSVTPTPTPVVDNTPAYTANMSLIGQKASDCEWIPGAEKKTSMYLTIDQNSPVKLEIFYTSGANAPSLTLVSPNTRVFSNKGDEYQEDITILNKRGQTVKDHPDIMYDILYIYTTNEKYAGKWQIAYSITDDVKETILCNCTVDEGWTSFIEEYKTPVKFFMLWYINPETSVYDASYLVDIVKAEEIPEINTMPSAEEDEVETADPYKIVIILCIIGVLAGCGLTIYLVRKYKAEKKNQKDFSINRANHKLKQKRKKENAQLENILDKYEDDYIDDFDTSKEVSYFKDESKIKETKVDTSKIKITKPEAVVPSGPKKEDYSDKEYNDALKNMQNNPNMIPGMIYAPMMAVPSGDGKGMTYVPAMPMMGNTMMTPNMPSAQANANNSQNAPNKKTVTEPAWKEQAKKSTQQNSKKSGNTFF